MSFMTADPWAAPALPTGTAKQRALRGLNLDQRARVLAEASAHLKADPNANPLAVLWQASADVAVGCSPYLDAENAAMQARAEGEVPAAPGRAA